MTILSWLGNLFIILGLWGIGNKRRGAFLFSIVGEALWVIVAGHRKDVAFVFICLVFFGLAIRNYIAWGKTNA